MIQLINCARIKRKEKRYRYRYMISVYRKQRRNRVRKTEQCSREDDYDMSKIWNIECRARII